MAITTTNARYEGFIFDGENSRTYGVYVTDVEVFGAPVRNVEMISIPGRNGSFALDKGSYENIQVTYKCAMGCESQADFNAGISAFRNTLASRTGYKRLEDEINTSEYRMACFRGGISVPTLNKETATFDVVFDCKPQRYLKSGETAVSVASGGTISNPTLYDAHPMLQVWGYGGMDINGEPLAINSEAIGEVVLANAKLAEQRNQIIDTFNSGMLNNSDKITVDGIKTIVYYTVPAGTTVWHADVTFTDGGSYGTVEFNSRGRLVVRFDPAQYTKSISRGNTYGWRAVVHADDSTYTITVSLTTQYDSSGKFTAYMERQGASVTSALLGRGAITGNSTKSALGEPLYFDLDIGEAYKVEDGAVVSVNNAVTIPAKLPVLVPGSNTITYDNTITQFKIVPRWWQL